MPQGSVLGPLLFLIYIDDLEDGVASNILKFADDTNIFRRVQTRQECHITGRFTCLHIGRANGKEPYEMDNMVLLKTSTENDLGVAISQEQCGIAARKENQLLGMVKRNITT